MQPQATKGDVPVSNVQGQRLSQGQEGQQPLGQPHPVAAPGQVLPHHGLAVARPVSSSQLPPPIVIQAVRVLVPLAASAYSRPPRSKRFPYRPGRTK